jgi:hypothetical protein
MKNLSEIFRNEFFFLAELDLLFLKSMEFFKSILILSNLLCSLLTRQRPNKKKHHDSFCLVFVFF